MLPIMLPKLKTIRTEKDPPKYFKVKPLKVTKEKDTLGNSDK